MYWIADQSRLISILTNQLINKLVDQLLSTRFECISVGNTGHCIFDLPLKMIVGGSVLPDAVQAKIIVTRLFSAPVVLTLTSLTPFFTMAAWHHVKVHGRLIHVAYQVLEEIMLLPLNLHLLTKCCYLALQITR